MTNNTTAIDFHQLMLEEKKRIRNQKKKKGKVDSDGEKHQKNNAMNVTTKGQHITESCTVEGQQLIDDEVWVLKDLPLLNRLRHIASSTSNTRTSMPSSVYYIPDFLHKDDYRERLITWLQGLPNNNNDERSNNDPNGKWTTMKYGKRRVALFDGIENELPYLLKVIGEALVSCGIFDESVAPNHVLINEYSATQGIMPHTDGPLYKDTTATISIGGGDVLLKFTPRLRTDQLTKVESSFNQKQTKTNNKNTTRSNEEDTPSAERQQEQQDGSSLSSELWLQGRGSLVVFEGDAYTNYCHGIDDRVTMEHAGNNCANAIPGQLITRGYRISLTFRHKFHDKKILPAKD